MNPANYLTLLLSKSCNVSVTGSHYFNVLLCDHVCFCQKKKKRVDLAPAESGCALLLKKNKFLCEGAEEKASIGDLLVNYFIWKTEFFRYKICAVSVLVKI